MSLNRDKARRYVRSHLAGAIDPIDSDVCWEPMNRGRPNGYVRVTFSGKSWYWHRLSFEAFHGPIPSGMDVCHKCDNRRCAKPSHLFAGTRTDNMRDAKRKGRLSTGAKHSVIVRLAIRRRGGRKLNEEKAAQIRSALSAGKTFRELAAEHGVHYTAIYKVWRREIWPEPSKVIPR